MGDEVGRGAGDWMYAIAIGSGVVHHSTVGTTRVHGDTVGIGHAMRKARIGRDAAIWIRQVGLPILLARIGATALPAHEASATDVLTRHHWIAAGSSSSTAAKACAGRETSKLGVEARWRDTRGGSHVDQATLRLERRTTSAVRRVIGRESISVPVQASRWTSLGIVHVICIEWESLCLLWLSLLHLTA